jgi:hypothetical protein
MTGMLRDLLSERAEAAGSPELDLQDLIAQGERRIRHRRGVAAASAASAVALTVGASFAFVQLGDRSTSPVGPSNNSPSVDVQPDITDRSRPLTYAEGTVIHYGDRTVTTVAPVAELDPTDDGVVVRTRDGGIWFTDGTGIDRVGSLGSPPPDANDGGLPGFVVSANTGSRAAWFEFPEPGDPVLVVYDTGSHEPVVDRDPVTVRGARWEMPAFLTQHYVYWYVDTTSGLDAVPPAAGYELATGEQSAVTLQDYLADQPPLGTPRTLEVGNADDGFLVVDGIGQFFGIRPGSTRIEAMAGDGDHLLDGATGRQLEFDVPDGYPFDNSSARLAQWIDDDTVVLKVQQPNSPAPGQDADYDLLVCHISTEACELSVTVPPDVTVPD